MFLGRKCPSCRPLPEIVICSSHHHHAVIGSYFLPEIFHGFNIALQGILTDHKEDRGLHLQEGVVNILQKQGELSSRTDPGHGAFGAKHLSELDEDFQKGQARAIPVHTNCIHKGEEYKLRGSF